MHKQCNLRMTKQRRVILTELRGVDTHPSADEVYETVRRRLPRISLGTVYRNLEILSELGEIQKLATGGPLKRFDGNPQPHYHIRCIRCNAVIDAPLRLLDTIEKPLKGATPYEIVGHRLEFLGICPTCRKDEP